MTEEQSMFMGRSKDMHELRWGMCVWVGGGGGASVFACLSVCLHVFVCCSFNCTVNFTAHKRLTTSLKNRVKTYFPFSSKFSNHQIS